MTDPGSESGIAKLAVVGPSFFGYLETVAATIEGRNIACSFYDERPTNTVLGKIFVRFAPRFLRDPRLKRHVDALIESVITAGTTHVLLVAVEAVTPAHVQKMKDNGITVCGYNWDSVENKPQIHEMADHLDGVASFDPKDCEQYGYKLIHLFSAMQRQLEDTAKKHDFFYCTTLHSNRPSHTVKLQAGIEKAGFSVLLYLYYHNKLLWLLRYASQPNVWPLLSKISTKPFSRTQIMEATLASRVVIDIHHGKQSGLTMRTFEALSMDAVLLTTNYATQRMLSDELSRRIVHLDMENIDGCLCAAIEAANQSHQAPLSAKSRQFLSVERFVDEILALLGVGK